MATVCNGTMNCAPDYDVYDATYCSSLSLMDLELNELLDIQDLGFRLPSIQNDVARIAADQRAISSPNRFTDELTDIVNKHELRNVDCMWSVFGSNSTAIGPSIKGGVSSASDSCGNSSNSSSAASSYSEVVAVPPSVVTGITFLIKREREEDEDEDDNEEYEEEEEVVEEEQKDNSTITENSHNRKDNCRKISVSSCRSTVNGRTATPTILIPKRVLQRDSCKMHIEPYIPPGGSLLRKSNTQHKPQQQQQQQQRWQHQQRHSAASTSQTTFQLDDEMLPEFRHNVDLRACVMGSNNISLTSSADANYIDHLSRELQNTSKERIDLPYRMSSEPQFSDVLEVLNQQAMESSSAIAAPAAVSAADVVATLSPPTTTATSSDCDSDDGDCSIVDSSCGSAASLDGNNALYMRHISDHSYTRCNDMETNLETPSDSDEEIDVVSLNDKKLPTNPSDRDRRVLQTKVAHKFSTGSPNAPQSRQYELPYTPASSSPVKSVINSRYPSPSTTPYQSAAAVAASYSTDSLFQSSSSSNSNNNCTSSSGSSSSSAGSDCTTPSAIMLNGKGRKRYMDCQPRMYPMKMNKPLSMHVAKKCRVKKATAGCRLEAFLDIDDLCMKPPRNDASTSASVISSSSSSSSGSGSNANCGSGSSMLKRQCSVDEADTIEKRNLHNDMERQRRIGLKNLFEALKKQIPNIRDKERAPKVNILREAAKLCEQLSSEERDLSLKRQALKAKLKQQQELLARLRLAKQAAE